MVVPLKLTMRLHDEGLLLVWEELFSPFLTEVSPVLLGSIRLDSAVRVPEDVLVLLGMRLLG